jgi:hypothetical protein
MKRRVLRALVRSYRWGIRPLPIPRWVFGGQPQRFQALVVLCGLVLGIVTARHRFLQREAPWLILLAAVPGLAWWVYRTHRFDQRRHRIGNGLCRRCGYDLKQNASGVCPECGTPVPRMLRVPHVRTPVPEPDLPPLPKRGFVLVRPYRFAQVVLVLGSLGFVASLAAWARSIFVHDRISWAGPDHCLHVVDSFAGRIRLERVVGWPAAEPLRWFGGTGASELPPVLQFDTVTSTPSARVVRRWRGMARVAVRLGTADWSGPTSADSSDLVAPTVHLVVTWTQVSYVIPSSVLGLLGALAAVRSIRRYGRRRTSRGDLLLDGT